MKYFRNANFISWVGKNMQFYFFVRKGKTRVGGSVNHGIKNSSPYYILFYLNANIHTGVPCFNRLGDVTVENQTNGCFYPCATIVCVCMCACARARVCVCVCLILHKSKLRG